MWSTDPRIRRERLQNQEVVIPTLEAWQEIIASPTLDDLPVLTSWDVSWLETYGGRYHRPDRDPLSPVN